MSQPMLLPAIVSVVTVIANGQEKIVIPLVMHDVKDAYRMTQMPVLSALADSIHLNVIHAGTIGLNLWIVMLSAS